MPPVFTITSLILILTCIHCVDPQRMPSWVGVNDWFADSSEDESFLLNSSFKYIVCRFVIYSKLFLPRVISAKNDNRNGSVCLSVTLWYNLNKRRHAIVWFSPKGSSKTLVKIYQMLSFPLILSGFHGHNTFQRWMSQNGAFCVIQLQIIHLLNLQCNLPLICSPQW